MGIDPNKPSIIRTAAQERVIEYVELQCKRKQEKIKETVLRRTEKILSDPRYLAAKNGTLGDPEQQREVIQAFEARVNCLQESSKKKLEKLLASLQNNPEYLAAKQGTPKNLDNVLKGLDNSRIQSDPDAEVDRKLFLDALYELLDSDIPITNENINTFYDIFRWEEDSYRRNGTVWKKMSEKCSKLPIKDKETFFNYCASTPSYKIPMIEEILKKTDHKEWIFYMFLLLGARGQILNLSSESQDKMIKYLFSSDEDIGHIIELFAQDNIPSAPLDEFWSWRSTESFLDCTDRCQNLPYKMKEKIKDFILEFDKVDNLIKTSRYHVDWSLMHFIEAFDIKSPLKIANSMGGWRKLKEYTDIEESKKAIDNMFESNDETFIPMLKDVFGGDRLWNNVDDKYKNPEYLNQHAECVAGWLSDDKKRKLLENLKLKIESESQDKTPKYSSQFIPRELCLKDFDLIKATVKLDENCHPRLLYEAKKNEGTLDKNSLLTIISNIIKGARNLGAKKQFMINLMEDVYNCKENEELIKMIFRNFNYFTPHFTPRQENKLVENFINLMATWRDGSDFLDAIYDKKIFKGSLLLKFRYELGASTKKKGKNEYDGDFKSLFDKVFKLIRKHSIIFSDEEVRCCGRDIPDGKLKQSLLMVRL